MTNHDNSPAPAPDTRATQARQIESYQPRSGYGELPGAEFPAAVYRSVIAAFVALVPISWAAFARDADGVLSLGFAAVLTIVFFALPVIVFRTARRHCEERPTALQTFLTSRVDTATGSLTGGEAWLQILIIPVVLVVAALLIGGVRVLVA
jgi:hypothetical protein